MWYCAGGSSSGAAVDDLVSMLTGMRQGEKYSLKAISEKLFGRSTHDTMRDWKPTISGESAPPWVLHLFIKMLTLQSLRTLRLFPTEIKRRGIDASTLLFLVPSPIGVGGTGQYNGHWTLGKQ